MDGYLDPAFKVIKRYPEGDRFIRARDERYGGFSYMLKRYEDPKDMYDAYDFFKKVVDGEIKLTVAKD